MYAIIIATIRCFDETNRIAFVVDRLEIFQQNEIIVWKNFDDSKIYSISIIKDIHPSFSAKISFFKKSNEIVPNKFRRAEDGKNGKQTRIPARIAE